VDKIAGTHTLNGMSVLEPGRHIWRASTCESPWTLLPAAELGDSQLLVADSWRVIDAEVRGLPLHRARFLAGVDSYRNDPDPHSSAASHSNAAWHNSAAAFFDDATAALPPAGDWFPRVELRTSAHNGTGTGTGTGTSTSTSTSTQFTLLVRPTPPIFDEVDVATAPYDPRTHPLVKGPNLDALMGLRAAVAPSGAGEAIILDANGIIVEGAYSGLLWWRGETLVQAASALPRIPSVTVDLLVAAARANGVTVVDEHARPANLDGCELWVLSALHGLRVARQWIDGPELAEPRHAALGQLWLQASCASGVSGKR
jgi:branched-subunit amino acid aminotransferase/4-amino-4-deoxychorismate lyase